MLLHATPLLERKSSRLLKKARRKTHLADVVDEPAEVSELLVLLGQTKSARDVSGVDGDGRRMARGVLIPGIERRHERSRKREACALQTFVGDPKLLRCVLLLSVETVEPVRGDRRRQKEHQAPA